MRRAALFAVALWIVSVTALAAQSSSASSDRSGLVKPNYSTSDTYNLSGAMCPVHMRALQGSGYGLLAVRDAPRVEGPSQTIHLVLVNPQSKKYASAKVVASGLSPKGRMQNAASGSGGHSEITKTLDVTFSPEDDKSMAADLVLPGFTAVSSIQLKSVTYQDGSSWNMDGQLVGMCRVAPDPLMLIANQ
jgi:hypothetical protein